MPGCCSTAFSMSAKRPSTWEGSLAFQRAREHPHVALRNGYREVVRPEEHEPFRNPASSWRRVQASHNLGPVNPLPDNARMAGVERCCHIEVPGWQLHCHWLAGSLCLAFLPSCRGQGDERRRGRRQCLALDEGKLRGA